MPHPKLERWSLIRDVLVFQAKLGLDAIRDLILSPFSVISAIIDIFRNPSLEKSYFYKLMTFGHKTDHWINLFGTRKPSETSSEQLQQFPEDENTGINPSENDNVDQLFRRVETLLKEQHSKGGLTASAKSSIDRYLNKIAKQQNINQVEAELVNNDKEEDKNE